MDIANKLKNIDIVDIIVRELQEKSTLVLICKSESMCDDLVYLLGNYAYQFMIGKTKSNNIGVMMSIDKGSGGELRLEQNPDDYNRLSETLKGNVRYIAIAFLGENNKLSIYHQTYPLMLPRNN
jgi:hypothetical protein